MSIKDWMKANVSMVQNIVCMLSLLVGLSIFYELYVILNTTSIMVATLAAGICFVKAYIVVVGIKTYRVVSIPRKC